MSTMRISTLVGAIAVTTLLTLTYILEGVARADLVPEPATILGCIAVVVLWLAYVCAHCRDVMIAAIIEHSASRAGDVLEAINGVVEEVGDRRATEARIETIAALNRTAPPGRPSPRIRPVN